MTLSSQPQRGGERRPQRESAEATMRGVEARHAPRNCRGSWAPSTLGEHGFERRGRDRRRRSFSKVERDDGLTHARDEHETTTADVTRARMSHGERVSRGDGGIDRVAPGLQHLDSGSRGSRLYRDYHAECTSRCQRPSCGKDGPRAQRVGRHGKRGRWERRRGLSRRYRRCSGAGRDSGAGWVSLLGANVTRDELRHSDPPHGPPRQGPPQHPLPAIDPSCRTVYVVNVIASQPWLLRARSRRSAHHDGSQLSTPYDRGRHRQ